MFDQIAKWGLVVLNVSIWAAAIVRTAKALFQ
jgi:hypothetical protein